MKLHNDDKQKTILLDYIIATIAALSGILFIVILAVQLILVQPSFLNGTNEKYNVATYLSMTNKELEKATEAMVLYVKGQLEEAQVTVEIDGVETEFFNEKEIAHLSDVRDVIKLINHIQIVLAVVCVLGIAFLIWKKKSKAVPVGVFGAWIILLIVSVIVGIITVVDVNYIIYGFHKLFFTNDLWLLDPAVDRSIWMFGNEMYVDALVRIATIIGTVCIFTNGVAMWGICRMRKK